MRALLIVALATLGQPVEMPPPPVPVPPMVSHEDPFPAAATPPPLPAIDKLPVTK